MYNLSLYYNTKYLFTPRRGYGLIIWRALAIFISEQNISLKYKNDTT
jgi:hypothetical protein